MLLLRLLPRLMLLLPLLMLLLRPLLRLLPSNIGAQHEKTGLRAGFFSSAHPEDKRRKISDVQTRTTAN